MECGTILAWASCLELTTALQQSLQGRTTYFYMNGDGRRNFVAIRTPGKQQDRFLICVAYSLPGKFEFISLEEIELSSGVESGSSTDVNETFVADVTGDGRVDIGAYHLHFYTCKNDPFFSTLYMVPSQGLSPLDKLTNFKWFWIMDIADV